MLSINRLISMYICWQNVINIQIDQYVHLLTECYQYTDWSVCASADRMLSINRLICWQNDWSICTSADRMLSIYRLINMYICWPNVINKQIDQYVHLLTECYQYTDWSVCTSADRMLSIYRLISMYICWQNVINKQIDQYVHLLTECYQ